MRQWFRIAAQAEPQVAELFVYDEIGKSWFNDDAVSALEFIAAIRALPAAVTTLRTHVNSPGGNPFEATAIANALRAESREHGRTIEVLIEGLAASAATIVTSAGDSIKIADNAIYMVHEPHAVALGTARDMRSMAEALDQVRDAIVATYRWVSPLSVEAIAELMAATTWMGAAAAVENGFATEVVPGVAVEARFQPEALGRLGSVPAAYRERIAALVAARPEPAPAPQPADPQAVIRACKAAGCAELADELLALPMPDVTARLDQIKAERATAAARATEIRALCVTAKLPQLADGLMRSAMPIADVKTHLTTLAALIDHHEIDTGLLPDAASGLRPPSALSPSAIYAARNGRPATAKGVPV